MIIIFLQACTCLSFAPGTSNNGISTDEKKSQLPKIVAGYSDGTVRMFDVNAVEMILKMHPHAVAVTAITFSSDGKI